MTHYRDNFDGADSTTPGSDWTEVAGDWNRVSGRIQSVGGGGATFPAMARYERDLATDDHACRIEFTNDVSPDAFLGPAVRFSASAKTGYVAFSRRTGSLRRIMKIVAGASTTLASDAGGGTKSRVQTLTADGSTVAFYDNSITASLSVTDTSITGHLRTGACGHSTSGLGATGDDFHAYDLPSTYLLHVELSPSDANAGDIARGRHWLYVDGVDTDIGCLVSNPSVAGAFNWSERVEDISDIFDPAATESFVRYKFSGDEGGEPVVDGQRVRRMWVERVSDGAVYWDHYAGTYPATTTDWVSFDSKTNPTYGDDPVQRCHTDFDHLFVNHFGDGYARHIIFGTPPSCSLILRPTVGYIGRGLMA